MCSSVSFFRCPGPKLKEVSSQTRGDIVGVVSVEKRRLFYIWDLESVSRTRPFGGPGRRGGLPNVDKKSTNSLLKPLFWVNYSLTFCRLTRNHNVVTTTAELNIVPFTNPSTVNYIRVCICTPNSTYTIL